MHQNVTQLTCPTRNQQQHELVIDVKQRVPIRTFIGAVETEKQRKSSEEYNYIFLI